MARMWRLIWWCWKKKFFVHNVSRIYDLKGAVISQYIADSSDCDTVYLDQNFVEDMHATQIYIGGRTKHFLQRAIWNYTYFLMVCIYFTSTAGKLSMLLSEYRLTKLLRLQPIHVMAYSLLVWEWTNKIMSLYSAASSITWGNTHVTINWRHG